MSIISNAGYTTAQRGERTISVDNSHVVIKGRDEDGDRTYMYANGEWGYTPTEIKVPQYIWFDPNNINEREWDEFNNSWSLEAMRIDIEDLEKIAGKYVTRPVFKKLFMTNPTTQ